MSKRIVTASGMTVVIALLVLFVLGRSPAPAQLTERPGNSLDNPIDVPRDLSGLSIKTPRIRIVHTVNPQLAGGSLYLQQVDPWLGYQWGRNLTQREFRERDGVYGGAGKLDGLLLADGKTRMMSRGHANSCAICHNTPYRDGGAGATIAKHGGEGRNTPPHARDSNSPGVAGYTFEVQCFGFGPVGLPGRPPVSTTIRSFIATPFDIHSGLQAFDPTTLHDPDGDGFAQVSNPGCLQCVTAAGKDRGLKRGPTGISLDDPDGDGYCEEISEGDLDVAEWYLLNHPAPARGEITDEVKDGERLFAKVGCAACHVA